MASDRGNLSRKMAAIVHADVTDSTALVQLNEALAHERINEAFSRFSQNIEHYSGTVHEIRGDALVAEFPRASDAVCAALAFQELHSQALTEIDDEIAPTIRIGVSLGEVIFADGQVTGAGVVLAQRVEQLAEPGGLCITAAIHEALPQHMPFDQYDLGEQEVKGFEEPVRVYRVSLKAGEIVPPPERTQQLKASNPLGVSAAVAAIVLVIAGGVAFWFQPWEPEEEPASVERMALPMPDKPSIAVLPFDNMSSDPDQDYFSDGLTENITTTLSQVPDIFVIARNSSFVYKGTSVKVQQIAEELGVRYVLEGSFQRSGDQIRVHAQLIDALTGNHLWAERYDRPWIDVFALQDDLTENIISALSVKLSQEQQAQLAKRYTDSPQAYDYFLRGQALFFRYSEEGNREAREMYQRAVDLDPGFARAHSGIALTHGYDSRFGWNDGDDQSLTLAKEAITTSLSLDDTLPQIYMVAGTIHLFSREVREAVAAAEKAIALDPSFADAYALVAIGLSYNGQADSALKWMAKAMRLNPHPPSVYYTAMGRALLLLGRAEEAVIQLERALQLNPSWIYAHVYLAAAVGKLGERDEAEWQKDQVLLLDPDFTVESWIAAELIINQAYLDQLAKALYLAGFQK